MEEDTYCDTKGKPDVMIFELQQQVWINFNIFTLPSNFQGVEFQYNIQELGKSWNN